MNLEILEKEVLNLYQFRDEYYTLHNGTLSSKEIDIKKKMRETVEFLEKNKDALDISKKGHLHYLHGKCLNVMKDYSPLAEAELGKATKFNCSLAWNELGECQYKKGDLNSAKTCFLKALETKNEILALRNLSMLMRSLEAKNPKDKKQNIEKGLEYARAALKKDVKDGSSWMVLGNAYLAYFFGIEAKMDVLKNCKAAYAKAEEDPIVKHFAELHFTKYHVEWYEEDYSKAFKSLRLAQQFEPSWSEVKIIYDQSHKFLSKLSQLTHSKGQISSKKLHTLISGIKPSQLGPYEHRGTDITAGKKPTLVSLAQLELGTNSDKIIQGRVVCTVVPDSGLPFAFCMVDREGTCHAITVYNWANVCGVKIGDSVAVVAPVLKMHLMKEENIPDFHSIRVAIPIMMVVNRRCVDSKQIAAFQVVSQYKPH